MKRISIPLFYTIIFSLIIKILPVISSDAIFTDETGSFVRIRWQPESIVSLAPNITEILFAIGAGSKVVGVTDYCNFPDEVKSKKRIGGFTNPSIESIINLKPDVVFATKDGNPRGAVERLRKLNVPVYVIDARDLEGITRAIIKIGEVTGNINEANILTNKIRKKLYDILNRTKKRKRVVFLYGIEPLIAAGGKTLADDLIRFSGGINIFSDATSYLRVNKEKILSRKPDIVILSEMGEGSLSAIKKLSSDFGKKIFTINGDIVNRPGPRVIEGLEELYRIINTEDK